MEAGFENAPVGFAAGGEAQTGGAGFEAGVADCSCHVIAD
jgi:hypothetical protein